MKLIMWLLAKWFHTVVDDYDDSENYRRLIQKLRPGDIILVQGRTRVARLIQRVTGSQWSHAALYFAADKILNTELGTGTEFVRKFFAFPNTIRICRYRKLGLKQIAILEQTAEEFIGCSYNIRHIFDMLRYLVIIPLVPRTWKTTLFDDAPSNVKKEICSHLIGVAYMNAGIDVAKGKPMKLLTPKDFDNSELFEVIK